MVVQRVAGRMSADGRRGADEFAAAHARGEIDDTEWFAAMAAIFADAYPRAPGSRGASGFGGDEARWELARRPIADAVERPGSFLDVGCAAGDLLESLVRWSPHALEPFGLELVPELAALARRRFPASADRIFVGNALDWTPPRRFDYVRTELVYVPPPRQEQLVHRLLAEVVAPDGRLIVCGYGSPRSRIVAQPVRLLLRSWGLEPSFELAVEAPEGGGSLLELAAVDA